MNGQQLVDFFASNRANWVIVRDQSASQRESEEAYLEETRTEHKNCVRGGAPDYFLESMVCTVAALEGVRRNRLAIELHCEEMIAYYDTLLERFAQQGIFPKEKS
jgi:hypothetical protein